MSNRFLSLSVVLRGLIQQLGIEKEMTLYRLCEHWEEVVGPQIASHTAPEKIHFHALSLRVDSAPWMYQLSFFKKEMIEKTNRFLGSQDPRLRESQKPLIREVYFKLAPIFHKKVLSDSKSTEQNITPHKTFSQKVALLDDEIGMFQDEALKKTIRQALERYFQEEARSPKGSRIRK